MKVEVNALGRVMRNLDRKEGKPGNNIQLTVDTELQSYIQARLGSESASAVVMNCRNGEKFLDQSINSVINQTYKNWELIFVDNMSEDNSQKMFSNFENKKMKYINTQQRVNLGTARQIALENCSV